MYVLFSLCLSSWNCLSRSRCGIGLNVGSKNGGTLPMATPVGCKTWARFSHVSGGHMADRFDIPGMVWFTAGRGRRPPKQLAGGHPAKTTSVPGKQPSDTSSNRIVLVFSNHFMDKIYTFWANIEGSGSTKWEDQAANAQTGQRVNIWRKT